MNSSPITIKKANFYFPQLPAEGLKIPATPERIGIFAETSEIRRLMPGHHWEEQGGVVAGIMPAEGGRPAYYLIVPETEAVELAWGGYGEKVDGISACDGLENTRLLMSSETEHPAAEYCAGLKLHGFDDYYLPSRREASLMTATVPHLFEPGYHWTSTQYSADSAFVQDFSVGNQYYDRKDNAWRVRAVRRFLID